MEKLHGEKQQLQINAPLTKSSSTRLDRKPPFLVSQKRI